MKRRWMALVVVGALVPALVPARAHASWLSSLLSLFKKKPAAAPAPPSPLEVTPEAQAELRDLIAAYWPRIRPTAEKSIAAALAAQSGQVHGALTVDRLAVTQLDLTAPPSITVTPIANGQEVQVGLGDWALGLDGHVSYLLDTKVLFVHVKTTIASDLTLDVKKLHAVEKIDLDTATDPTWPTIAQVQHPSLDFDLTIKTHHLIVDAVLALLKPIIHLVLAGEIDKALAALDPVLGSLKGQPGAPWGTGGPGFTPFGQTPDLEKAALMASEDIQNDHTPFGTVYEADFSQPVYRQGTVTSWSGLGDSPIWTGSYLTGEALRYATTRDPLAVANARKVLAGIKLLLDVQDPASGRLSRYAVPLSSPFAQTLLPIGGTQWIATVNGQQYVCEEDISRDQHDGVMMGLSLAYDLFDDKQVKADAASLIQRIVDFLESTGWNALRRDGSVSAPFVQSPAAIVAFTAAAERTDPVKYGALRTKRGRIASFDWIGTMVGCIDPLDSYYKWNLGHTVYYTALRLETDPDRYKHLEKSFAIMRHAVGHHRNSWFDGVEAALDPAARTRLGPQVTDDLYRLVARGRRDRTILNSQDPTIAQATYQAGIQVPGGVTVGGYGIPVGSPPHTIAKYPVPVEKRPNSDFIWQRNPFDLDGNGDPHHQAPGVDIVLPYWLGRYHGFVK